MMTYLPVLGKIIYVAIYFQPAIQTVSLFSNLLQNEGMFTGTVCVKTANLRGGEKRFAKKVFMKSYYEKSVFSKIKARILTVHLRL